MSTVAHQMLNFMSEYGRSYLASGGPTSRLEDDLARLGEKLGFSTSIFATPTGIFVGCLDSDGQNTTTILRIKDNSIDLGKLCWLESIFQDLFSEKISLTSATKILKNPAVGKSPYKLWQSFLAAFIAGFALSFPAYSKLTPALASGAIATITWWISGPGLKHRIPSPIFRDFFGCLVTLVISAVCQLVLRGPFEAYAIGGLVVLVPGLALTTAISELADQNLVSGTAKFMQAVLTLLALGLAYILFQDFTLATHLPMAGPSVVKPLSWSAAAIGAALSVGCFGVLFKVPLKSLPWASLTGVLGWVILRKFTNTEYVVAANFLGSFAVGFVSLSLGHWFRVPSQVFSVPGIIAMLPGMLALTSFRSLAMGQQESGLELAVRVALTAGSIVFGLFTARIPFSMTSFQIPRRKSKKAV